MEFDDPGLDMPIEVEKPRDSMGICRPAGVTDANQSIAQHGVIVVPRVDTGPFRRYDIKGVCPPKRASALDHCRANPTARLDQLGFTTPVLP